MVGGFFYSIGNTACFLRHTKDVIQRDDEAKRRPQLAGASNVLTQKDLL